MNGQVQVLGARKPVTRQVNFSTSAGWRESHSCRVIASDVDFMSYYRDVYLKSDEWKSLRLERLAFAKFRCELCGLSPETLDVHHLTYRRLFNVRASDLRALCRDCHDRAHFLMKKYKKLKTLNRSMQWSVIKRHIAKGVPARNLKAVCEWRHICKRQANKMTRINRFFRAQKDFSLCRDVLVSLRLIKRNKMKWSEKIASINGGPSIAIHISNPFRFLTEYIAATGIDPRFHTDRIGAQKLLTFP